MEVCKLSQSTLSINDGAEYLRISEGYQRILNQKPGTHCNPGARAYQGELRENIAESVVRAFESIDYLQGLPEIPRAECD